MCFFFGVTWLSTVFASAPPILESPFVSFSHHHSAKILSCAHCVPATALNLGGHCENDTQNAALTEPAFGEETIKEENGERGIRNRHCGSELGWGVQSATLNWRGRQDLTQEVTFHKGPLLQKPGDQAKATCDVFAEVYRSKGASQVMWGDGHSSQR